MSAINLLVGVNETGNNLIYKFDARFEIGGMVCK
jgi:hypothetical protein